MPVLRPRSGRDLALALTSWGDRLNAVIYANRIVHAFRLNRAEPVRALRARGPEPVPVLTQGYRSRASTTVTSSPSTFISQRSALSQVAPFMLSSRHNVSPLK
jgi:hypothetical protein